jgi:prepilin-type processing-associated H-X9-DG protein
MIMSGDRNLTNNATVGGGTAFERIGLNGLSARLTTNQVPTTTGTGAGYTKDTHQNAGNICLGDGSVQQVTTSRLREYLRDSGNNENLVGLPD